jgi:hypothetical protein
MGPCDDEGPAGRVLERRRRRRPRADARDLEPGARGAGAHSFELVDGGSPLRESNGGHEIAAAHDCRDVGIERLGRPLDRRSRGGCLCLGGRNRRDELRDVLGREVRRAHLRDVQTKAQVVRNLQRSMTSSLPLHMDGSIPECLDPATPGRSADGLSGPHRRPGRPVGIDRVERLGLQKSLREAVELVAMVAQ